MPKLTKTKRLRDSYRFPGFHPALIISGMFGDPRARVIRLTRRSKKRCAEFVAGYKVGGMTANCARSGIFPQETCASTLIRRIDCRSCQGVKQEKLDWLADNPFYTKRFAFYIGRRCRSSSIQDVAKEHLLDWRAVKTLEMQYMREQIKRAGQPSPGVIGIDDISTRKGHIYRIVVSDLERRRAIWFGGKDRSEESMDMFFAFLGERRSKRIRLAVMDMWKPFLKSTN